MKTKFLGCMIMCICLTCSCGSGSNKSSSAPADDNYQKAVSENDFGRAHECLGVIYKDFEECWDKYYSRLDYDNDYRDQITLKANKYSTAATYVLSAEVRYLMITYGDEATTRILYLLNEIVSLRGEKVKGMGYHPHGVDHLQQACLKLDCYNETAKYNNALCDLVIDLSIVSGNKRLAEYALTRYMEKWEMNNSFLGDNVSWNKSDLIAAQEKFDAAVRNGSFNNH